MWVLLGHLERGEGPAASDRAAGDDRLGRHLRASGPDRSGPRGTHVLRFLFAPRPDMRRDFAPDGCIAQSIDFIGRYFQS